MFSIRISGGEGNRIGYLSVVCIAASLLWFESTEVWEEVQSVDRFGYKWQMTTIALVGSAHPTFRRERMASLSRIRSASCIRLTASRLLGGIAGMARSYNAVPELICGIASEFMETPFQKVLCLL